VTYLIFIEISEGDIPGSSLKYPGVIYPVPGVIYFIEISRGDIPDFFIKISGGDIPGYSLKSV
jgi:hypothetical protein